MYRSVCRTRLQTERRKDAPRRKMLLVEKLWRCGSRRVCMRKPAPLYTSARMRIKREGNTTTSAETRGSSRYVYIPKELHAGRLWVTKYGRGNVRERESKKENSSVESWWENEAVRKTGEDRERGNKKVKDRMKRKERAIA